MATQAAATRPLGALGRIGIVAGMHAALLLVLVRGFGIGPAALLPPDITGEVFDERPTVEPPPPPPNYVPQNTQVVLPQPDLYQLPTDSGETAITAELRPVGEIGPGAGPVVPVPVIQNVRLDPRRPLSQPPYPAAEQRMGVEGAVDVEIYVLPDGKVGDARVFRSSGSERMDQATLDEAKRRWRLVPATRDGVPFAQWYRLRVKFELKN